MIEKLNRRDFIRAGAAAGLTAAVPQALLGQAPANPKKCLAPPTSATSHLQAPAGAAGP
jgi:hypothetical protein